jgi:hypothetical protein
VKRDKWPGPGSGVAVFVGLRLVFGFCGKAKFSLHFDTSMLQRNDWFRCQKLN